MRLLARTGSEAHYVLGTILIGIFGLVPRNVDPMMLVVFAAIIFAGRWILGVSANAASVVTLDAHEIVASFTLRSSLRIPFSRIAAIDVQRRAWGGRLGKSSAMTFITIFRHDEPAVIEIAAESSEAEPFLDRLMGSARLQGRTRPFVRPWSFYARDLLPMVPLVAFVLLFPSIHWIACVAGAIGYVVGSALFWRRWSKMATRLRASSR